MDKQEVIDLIKDAGYGVLATVEGDTPKARPMMPYLTEEGDLLIATMAQKRVVGQIKANSRVEVCFIDRKMNFARVSGNASVSNDMENKKLIWNNVPMLRQYFSGPEDANFILVRIDTSTVETMTPQQMEPEVLKLK
ncbi:MAG: pyridoxamine 5'-phosphate oxidase family protein [Candidatus Omnitrophica bacterium]|nr:pyridoxamine 5'-phosphate oxidase family protein [Candidatus Omnitrophota bacterium]